MLLIFRPGRQWCADLGTPRLLHRLGVARDGRASFESGRGRKRSARGRAKKRVREVFCCTCWWYSLCNFQYWEHYERARITLTVECIRTCVFVVHVGGTRCVTSSTGNIMKIQARITLTVEVIRTCIFFMFMCQYKDEYDQD
jgi:hypothetical protein